MRKDLNAIWARKGIRALLVILPVVLLVVIPIVYSVAISLFTVEEGSFPELLRAKLSSESASHGPRQFWMEAFTTLLCPILFLSVPIICAVISAACAFVEEKQAGTLETIWLSSMSSRSIFNAKIAVCTLISVAISLVSFFAFFITVTVADIIMGATFFFSFEWLLIVVLLMPAVALFSVVFVSLLLPRMGSVQEAMQTIGYLILPFLLLYFVQFAGSFKVTFLFLLVVTILLFGAIIVMFNISSRRFRAELLFARQNDD